MRNLTIFTHKKAEKPMRAVGQFTVEPRLPENLVNLKELALNLRWAWDHESRDLFRHLDPELWEISGHNPYMMLGLIDQNRIEEVADDEAFLARLERVFADYQVYMATKNTWHEKHCKRKTEGCFAYFSTEFGLTECMPIYSGGLGVLSGDHLKSASDLGLPLVAVGLLYQEGYFQQYLSSDGWQQESYPKNDFFSMPITKVRTEDGSAVTIEIDFPGRRVFAQLWKVQVGRVPLYLLDTNLDANSASDQNITDELYGGDREMRIEQEILLGVGGVKALKAIGCEPVMFHMNEGHSAFLGLERIRVLTREKGLSVNEAIEVVKGGTVFTTHTPVPAGIDRFSPQLVDKYFSKFWEDIGLSRQEFFALGRQDPKDDNEPFNMAILALKLSEKANGVSKLHGVVSRRMWQNLWPGIPEMEIPISSVTNGVHTKSYMSSDMDELFNRYLGPRWYDEAPDSDIWEKVESIPPMELWRTHERRRERLVAFARKRLRKQLEARGAPPSEIEESGEVLDPNALTIGFARRFATYKRGSLILKDPDRLSNILNNPRQPVQIIFSGKAHPQDQYGKEIIRNIVHLAREERFRRRIVFLENYDLAVARYLVQGVDVWLNNPRRFQEASGTSGMKAASNGALNVSILDGWWDEAHSIDNGWAIGKGEVYDDYDYQDMVESRALYSVLEKSVVPLFYDRSSDNIPRAWIGMMKNSMKRLTPAFSSDRMVGEYMYTSYIPAGDRYAELVANDFELAKKLAAWREQIMDVWDKVRILSVNAEKSATVKVGQKIPVTAEVRIDPLTSEDVSVEVVHGPISGGGMIEGVIIENMKLDGPAGQGILRFKAEFVCRTSGRYGYTVRVRPYQGTMMGRPELSPTQWAELEVH